MAWVTYGLTLLVEIPVYLLLLRRLGWLARAGLGRSLFAAWLVNLTQPVLTAVAPAGWEALMLAELGIAAIEGLALWLLLRGRIPGARLTDGLAMGVLANAASVLAGFAVLPLLPL